MDLRELLGRWRREAEVLRRHGAAEAAATKEVDADELEAFAREHALEPLTLGQAAVESGYSPSHLGRLIAERRLENAGERHAPRIRRGDLPRKPLRRKSPVRRLHNGDPDLVSSVLADQGVAGTP